MIREDLLSKIKEIYKIKEFNYIGSEKNLYSSNYPFLLFASDQNLMAIRKSDMEKGIYHLEVIAKADRFDYYYVCDYRNCILKIEGNETVLAKISVIFDTIEYRFPGKAFDFDKEFIIATLENGRGDL